MRLQANALVVKRGGCSSGLWLVFFILHIGLVLTEEEPPLSAYTEILTNKGENGPCRGPAEDTAPGYVDTRLSSPAENDQCEQLCTASVDVDGLPLLQPCLGYEVLVNGSHCELWIQAPTHTFAFVGGEAWRPSSSYRCFVRAAPAPPAPTPQPSPPPASFPLTLMHYMPWFTLNAWYSHWTMRLHRRDGLSLMDRYLTTGRVAAHMTPLVGPYASDDEDTIRLHLRLMKAAGVAGVVVLWYGTSDADNFGFVRHSTLKTIKVAAKLGMLFTVCYTDRGIIAGKTRGDASWMANATELAAAKARLRADFEYLRTELMSLPGWVRERSRGTEGRSLIFVFGPQLLFDAVAWSDTLDAVFAQEEERPLLLGVARLNRGRGPYAEDLLEGGNFDWPGWELIADASEESSAPQARDFTDRFYARARSRGWSPLVGSAFPQWRDFYLEGSLGNASWGGKLFPPSGGETLEATLSSAVDNAADLVQVATWNDFQEGTVLEPSSEHGYEFLLRLQERLLGLRNTEVFREAVARYNELKSGELNFCEHVPYQERVGCELTPGTVIRDAAQCLESRCCWQPTSLASSPSCFERAKEPRCPEAVALRDCDLLPEDRLCCFYHGASQVPPSAPEEPAIGFLGPLIAAAVGACLIATLVLSLYTCSRFAGPRKGRQRWRARVEATAQNSGIPLSTS